MDQQLWARSRDYNNRSVTSPHYNRRGLVKRLRVAALVLLLCGSLKPASAQWLQQRDPRLPRTADGKPDLTAPAPRLADGSPDLSGIWYPDFAATDPARANAPGQTLGEDPVIRLSSSDGKPIPLLPDAKVAFDERQKNGTASPVTRCLPHSIPDAMIVPAPFKFIHSAGLTIILLEEYNHFRQIFTDGRAFPPDMQPAWFGYSIGRWDGDTFVVQTAGFNDKSWLGNGFTHTEQLRTTERFRRMNLGTMQLQVTIDDPKTFERPWTTQTIWFRLMPDTDFIENICENERDVPHLRGE